MALREREVLDTFKEEALDRNLWRTGFGRDSGTVVRMQNEWTMREAV
jgi:hypothetical protein